MYSKLLKEKEETGLGSLSSDEFCRTDTTHVKHIVNEAYAAFREKNHPQRKLLSNKLYSSRAQEGTNTEEQIHPVSNMERQSVPHQVIIKVWKNKNQNPGKDDRTQNA